MNMVSIDVPFQSSKVYPTTFSSRESLLEFDAVIWDPSAAMAQYSVDFPATYQGLRSINSDDSVRMRKDLARRRREFAELLSLGRPLVVFTAPPIECYIHTGEVRTSGTGRNAHRQAVVERANVLSALPVRLATEEGVGDRIEVRGNDAVRRFYDKTKDDLYYRASITSAMDEILFVIAGTGRPIGGLLRADKGFVVALPMLYVPDSYSRQKRGAIERRFVDQLIVLLEELGRGPEDVPLPAWTFRYQLPSEAEYDLELERLHQQAKTLQESIGIRAKELERLRRYKGLLTSSGNALEGLVAQALSELGFDVALGAPGRDDLIVRYGNAVAVVEVKGVSKSAAEKHCAQLEKWVSEYYTAHDLKPKGILVANAFRDLPVDERTDAAFPDQMLAYAISREHCLLSTAQLLTLVFRAKADPGERDNIVQTLLSTNGILGGSDDWREVLILREESTELATHN